MASGRSEENIAAEVAAASASAQQEKTVPDKQEEPASGKKEESKREEPSQAPQPTPEPDDDKKKDSKDYEENMLAMIQSFQNTVVDPLGDALADKLKDSVQDAFKWYRSNKTDNKEEAPAEEQNLDSQRDQKPSNDTSGDATDVNDTNPEGIDDETLAKTNAAVGGGSSTTTVEAGSIETGGIEAASIGNRGESPSPQRPMIEGGDSRNEFTEQKKAVSTAETNETENKKLETEVTKVVLESQGVDPATAGALSKQLT